MASDRFLRDWYCHAHYHAVVARSEHTEAACSFVLRCCREHGRGTPESGLELCCGAALLSRDLHGRGVAMTAVDLHPEVVEYASARVPGVRFEAASMVDYRAPRPVDLVTNLGDNLSLLRTSREMVQHLRSVAANLKPGGLYFCHLSKAWVLPPLGLLRVEPPWLVYRFPEDEVNVGAEDGLRVEIDWVNASEIRIDPMRQLFQHRLVMTISQGTEVRRLESLETGRLWYPQEFLAMAEFAGDLEHLGWFHDYRLTSRCDRYPQAHYCIAVLRRPPGGGGPGTENQTDA